MRRRDLLLLPAGAALAGCSGRTRAPDTRATIGQVVALDPAFVDQIAVDAPIEVLAEGFTWAEGPTWVGATRDGYLLFTDVPANTLYRWSETRGLSVLLHPSGYDGPEAVTLREAGANGLYAEPDGQVLLADSGSRALARLDPVTGRKTWLATHYQGQRFNSPNDVVRGADGTIYFTDPPFGLKDIDASPVKEMRFNGVWRLDRNGALEPIEQSLSFPNGIALSPDGRTLYVSNTDARRPVWMAYTLDSGGRAQDRRVFADASGMTGPGLPDGMAIGMDGHVYATGPGGVLVFTPAGRLLGRIETGAPVANCAFGGDGRWLYLATQSRLARIRTRQPGLGFV